TVASSTSSVNQACHCGFWPNFATAYEICGLESRFIVIAVPVSTPMRVAGEFNEPVFRFGLICPILVAPYEPDSARVERLVRQNQSPALLLGLPTHREVQIKVF